MRGALFRHQRRHEQLGAEAEVTLAEGDTYMKRPNDDTYSLLAVNYLKLDKVPAYNESWAPVVEEIQKGNSLGTIGEILFHN